MFTHGEDISTPRAHHGPSTFAYLWLWIWSPAGQQRVIGNAPTFVDELRGSRGGGGAFVAHFRPSLGYCGVSPCTCLGAQYFFDESSVSRGPDDLAGSDKHSVELTEARNQS